MIAVLASLLIARRPSLTLPYARRLVKLGLLAVSVLIAVVAFSCRLSAESEQAEQRGETRAVAAGQETTLRQIGEANEAGNQVRNNAGDARYRQCLQDVEPGFEGSCERYRVEQPVSDR